MSWNYGQLSPSFSIACGKCRTYLVERIVDSRYAIARDRAKAGEMLKDNGWARTRAWGWICPKCDKGTQGGTPE